MIPANQPRWPRRVALALGILGILWLGFRFGLPWALDVWADRQLPTDAPNIAITPNDTWLSELNINEAYKYSVTRAGGRLVTMKPETVTADPALIEAWLEANKINGVILSGGGDVDPSLYGQPGLKASEVNRKRDEFEIALIQVAVRKGLPVLGICRGCQILNVARGGTLKNLGNNATLADLHFNSDGHQVTLIEGSRLAEINTPPQLAVGSYHRQAVDRLGANLLITATGPGGVVEAIEGNASGDPWLVAVQWHPELAVDNDRQQRLLRAFVEAAKR
jgi:putative glutamine amidotransferase